MVPAAAKATTVAMVPAAAKVTTMAEATTMAVLGPQNGRREPPLKLGTRRLSAAFPWMRTLQ